jgi:hypothetical protein
MEARLRKLEQTSSAERHFTRLPENRGSPRILYINTGVPRCELALGF